MAIQVFKRDEHDEKIKELKLELCALIKHAAIRNGWSQQYMAAALGTSPRAVAHLTQMRVHRVTFNQIFNYLVAIDPKMMMLVSLWPNSAVSICQLRHSRD